MESQEGPPPIVSSKPTFVPKPRTTVVKAPPRPAPSRDTARPTNAAAAPPAPAETPNGRQTAVADSAPNAALSKAPSSGRPPPPRAPAAAAKEATATSEQTEATGRETSLSQAPVKKPPVAGRPPPPRAPVKKETSEGSVNQTVSNSEPVQLQAPPRKHAAKKDKETTTERNVSRELSPQSSTTTETPTAPIPPVATESPKRGAPPPRPAPPARPPPPTRKPEANRSTALPTASTSTTASTTSTTTTPSSSTTSAASSSTPSKADLVESSLVRTRTTPAPTSNVVGSKVHNAIAPRRLERPPDSVYAAAHAAAMVAAGNEEPDEYALKMMIPQEKGLDPFRGGFPAVDLITAVSTSGHRVPDGMTVRRTSCVGYLYKLGAMRKNWKYRYFELNTMSTSPDPNDAPGLRYRVDHTSTELKGFIALSTVKSVEIANLPSDGFYYFDIKAGDRTYQMRTYNKQCIAVWVALLKACIGKY